LKDPLGECVPEIVGDVADVCSGCHTPCLTGCPGAEVNFPELYKFVYGELPPDYLMGHTLRHRIGYATDPAIRRRGSSGGVISAVLNYLLKEKKIDGVLTLVDLPDKPLQPQAKIITDVKDLLAAAQSKYCLAPVNTILREIGERNGKFAYVGLPCQIHSIRKLQMIHDPNVRNLSLLIGSYCGSINYFTSINDFLKKNKVNDLSLVRRIQYRAGEWPGKLLIKLNNGKEFELEKFYANYMTMFYTVKRCQVCFDLTNEFADISAADAWSPKYEERGKGYSLFISRTALGEKVIKECLEKGVLVSKVEIQKQEVMAMHSHMIDNKKIGAVVRSKMWSVLGREVPDYHLTIQGLPLKRALLGVIVGFAFVIGGTKPARWFVRQLPMKLTGYVFKSFRNKWKKATKPKTHIPEYQFIPVNNKTNG
jgi:coenzyme F420 hydrogenase subunit beta